MGGGEQVDQQALPSALQVKQPRENIKTKQSNACPSCTKQPTFQPLSLPLNFLWTPEYLSLHVIILQS
jgi:hypothetical protein